MEAKEGHSFEVDIWYLGVVIFSLLVGQHPFKSDDLKTAYTRIKSNCLAFPVGVI